jgi:hypothetical protein
MPAEGKEGFRTGFRLWPGPGRLEAVVPEVLFEAVDTGLPALEATASWAASCPPPFSLSPSIRALVEGAWSPWYSLGSWSEGDRASAGSQEDDIARMATDTLILTRPASAFQLKASLVGRASTVAATHPGPSLDAMALAWSTGRPKPGAGPDPGQAPALAQPARPRPLAIQGLPAWSQMAYARGKGWCSPTALSMVLAYWEGAAGLGAREVEYRITRTAEAVWDSAYEGCGNWAFNAAYAASLGYAAVVRRFARLSEAEAWLEAGVPPILSVSWGGERPLAGAPLAASRGHLLVLAGRDAAGDPLVHDPAAPEASLVPRTYARAELEARWLEASGGTAYLVWPKGRRVPL